jgi:hypothetical protein
VVALAVGIGVDYGIYIYATFADAVAAGYKFEEAYYRTLKMTGWLYRLLANPAPSRSYSSSRIACSRNAARLLSSASIPSRIAAQMMLTRMKTKMTPITTSRISDPNKPTSIPVKVRR